MTLRLVMTCGAQIEETHMIDSTFLSCLALFVVVVSFGALNFGSAELQKFGWLGMCAGCAALMIFRIIA